MAQRDLFLQPHQARTHEATAYENALADALETAFSRNINELSQLVDYLNEKGPASPSNVSWTQENFLSEIHRLGD